MRSGPRPLQMVHVGGILPYDSNVTVPAENWYYHECNISLKPYWLVGASLAASTLGHIAVISCIDGCCRSADDSAHEGDAASRSRQQLLPVAGSEGGGSKVDSGWCCHCSRSRRRCAKGFYLWGTALAHCVASFLTLAAYRHHLNSLGGWTIYNCLAVFVANSSYVAGGAAGVLAGAARAAEDENRTSSPCGTCSNPNRALPRLLASILSFFFIPFALTHWLAGAVVYIWFIVAAIGVLLLLWCVPLVPLWVLYPSDGVTGVSVSPVRLRERMIQRGGCLGRAAAATKRPRIESEASFRSAYAVGAMVLVVLIVPVTNYMALLYTDSAPSCEYRDACRAGITVAACGHWTPRTGPTPRRAPAFKAGAAPEAPQCVSCHLHANPTSFARCALLNNARLTRARPGRDRP